MSQIESGFQTANLAYIQNPRHTFQSWRDRYLKRLRHLGHRPGGPAPEVESIAPGRLSTVPKPKTTTQTPKPRVPEPDLQTKSSNIEIENHVREDTAAAAAAAANKRKRPSIEENSAISHVESSHAVQKKRKISQDDPAEEESPAETSDESQSAKYQTAPQFPVVDEGQLDDDDTLVPLPTYDEEEVEENGSAGDLEAWIQKRVDAGRKLDDILKALDCTSMNAGLADKVLDLLSREKKIPDDMQGVWTEEDDQALTRYIPRI